MRKIRFIANPFSGNSKARQLATLLEKYLKKGVFDFEIRYTDYSGHATILAKEAVEEQFDIVVAVGGDGSVNEVARGLIGTQTALGIVPAGSGNGLSTHLKIGRNAVKTIKNLHTYQAQLIDTCKVNGIPFINLAGIGFDANVAARLKGSKLRGFKGYFTYGFKEALDYEMQEMEIEWNGQRISRNCFTVAIANAPMYGYGFSVAPKAIYNDGKLEIMILKAAPKWRYLLESYRYLNATLDKSSLAERYAAEEVTIYPKKLPVAVHFDGESMLHTEGALKFKVVPKSLHLWSPSL